MPSACSLQTVYISNKTERKKIIERERERERACRPENDYRRMPKTHRRQQWMEIKLVAFRIQLRIPKARIPSVTYHGCMIRGLTQLKQTPSTTLPLSAMSSSVSQSFTFSAL